jgi:Second Messenger Oligonucleotide or Dinucleotide Synthetase domain
MSTGRSSVIASLETALLNNLGRDGFTLKLLELISLRLSIVFPLPRFRLLFYLVLCIKYSGGNVALEDSLKSWAKAPGQTEQETCDKAVSAVRKAINTTETLSKHTIKVFAQGSYCNRTNVREDSDVDVCVCCSDSLMCDYPEGMKNTDFGLSSPADYSYSTFKNDVGSALTSYFKNGHVTRGNKAFDIKENTYRIAADVVPCFEHRRYRKTERGSRALRSSPTAAGASSIGLTRTTTMA